MTAPLSMQTVLTWIMPMNSHRRLIGRTIKQAITGRSGLSKRVNKTGIANFLRYRKQRFHCPVCGSDTTPLYDFPDLDLRHLHMIGELRETLQCRACYASMRQRALALALIDFVWRRTGVMHSSIAHLATAGLQGLRILDTDNFSAISRALRADPSFVRCSYLPNLPWGTEIESGYFNINLERIDFPNDSFDVVMTSDVMEHVRNSDAAHESIVRVLKPNGGYIFTVPYDESSAEDIVLVDTSGKDDIFLCEPHYHGDPLTGGILAYRVFGTSIIEKLNAIGFDVAFQRLKSQNNLVLDGDVFTAIKRLPVKS